MITTQKKGMHNLFEESNSESEYVIISKVGSDRGGFLIAEGGGFLSEYAGEFYKCKRQVAETLNLCVIANCPMTMY